MILNEFPVDVEEVWNDIDTTSLTCSREIIEIWNSFYKNMDPKEVEKLLLEASLDKEQLKLYFNKLKKLLTTRLKQNEANPNTELCKINQMIADLEK